MRRMGQGASPRTTLTRNPQRALVTGHENLVLRFGSAQKIRVHGGCPLPHPPPLAEQSPKTSASVVVAGGGRSVRAGLGGAGQRVAGGSESDEP